MIKKLVDYIGSPENSKQKNLIGYIALVVVVVADIWVQLANYLEAKHAVHAAHAAHVTYLWDKIPGWGAFYGFVSCVVIILVSKFIGHQGGIMKKEDYYD
jgi:hypothetical protein